MGLIVEASVNTVSLLTLVSIELPRLQILDTLGCQL